jgi:hypothetical protein
MAIIAAAFAEDVSCERFPFAPLALPRLPDGVHSMSILRMVLP